MNKRQLKKEYRKAQTKVLILSEVNSSLRFQLRGRAHQMQLMAQEYQGYKVVADQNLWQAKLEAAHYRKALDRAQAERLRLAEEQALPEDLKWVNDTPLWWECTVLLGSGAVMLFAILGVASLW